MKKILNVHEPLSATYSHTANTLAIIGDEEGVDPWLMNCFIQIFGSNEVFLDYQDFGFMECPIIHSQHIGLDLVKEGWKHITEFVKKAIQLEYYVYAELNVSKIKAFNLKWPFAHDVLIYGFDDETEEYFIADFFNGKKYTFTRVSYKEIEDAFSYDASIFGRTGIFFDDIFLLKPKDDKNAIFSVDKVKDSLTLYLEEKPMIYGFNRFKPYNVKEVQDYYYGIGCYNIFFNIIEKTKENRLLPNRWRQIIHLMYEHKKIMGIRLKYMNVRNYLSNSHAYIDEYKLIEEKMFKVRNLFLKYSLSGKEHTLESIKENLLCVRDMERNVIPSILKDIMVV